jgi:lipopolysaccharide exporter
VWLRRLVANGAPHQIGSVARNVAVVGGLTAIGQGALILASPLLTRLYDPQAFGLLSVYSAVLSILVAGASLRFDLAIPIARDPDEAIHLLALSVLIALIASVLVGLVGLVFGEPLLTALGAAALAPFVWLLPVALFVASVAQAVASWAVFHRSFPALGRMRSMQGLAQATCQVVLGFIGLGSAGLVIGDVAGRLVGAEQLLNPLRKTLQSTKLTWTAMRQYRRERWGFARVMTLASLVNAMTLQIPFLMIPAAFDLESSGQYFLAYRVLVLPASLVGSAVSQVFFGEASFRRDDPKRLRDLAFNVTISLFVFSIPTYAVVAAGGPALVQALFGDQWGQAGQIVRILAPSLVLWAVASPISTLLLVGRREVESLAFTVAELGLRFGALALGAYLHSLVIGVLVLSVADVAINIGALWRFLRVASVHLSELVRPTVRILALSIPSVCLVIALSLSAPPLILILGTGMAWAAALGLAARLSPELRTMLSGTHD